LTLLVRSRSGRGQLHRVFDGLDQAQLVGDAFARDVEGRSVIDRGANDRQAEPDIDAGESVPDAGRGIDLEAEELQ
jgi:hypothetical protein